MLIISRTPSCMARDRPSPYEQSSAWLTGRRALQARTLPRPTSRVVPGILTRSRSGERELQFAPRAEWCVARDRPSPYEQSGAWLPGRRALQARNLPRPTSIGVPGILTRSRSGARELQRALRAAWCLARDRPSPYEHSAWFTGRRALQARNLPRPTSKVVHGSPVGALCKRAISLALRAKWCMAS